MDLNSKNKKKTVVSKGPKNKIKKLISLEQSESDSNNNEIVESDDGLEIESSPPDKEVVSIDGIIKPIKERNKQFPFSDEEKLHLYNWLVENEMVNVSHKVFPKISDEHLRKLTLKGCEYRRCSKTCQAVQLYNMFKSNRKIFTDHLAVSKKSGAEAPDLTSYSELNQSIIQIYTKYHEKSGTPLVTRTRNLTSKVSIS